MSLPDLLTVLESNKIKLEIVEGQLKAQATKGKISADILSALREHKDDIVAMLEGQEAATREGILPIEDQDHYELSHGQRRLWVLNELEEHTAAYNMFTSYIVERVNREVLRQAFLKLIRRHEILRTTFIEIEDCPRQVVHSVDEFSFDVVYVDLRGWEDKEQVAQSIARKEVNTPFDLAAGPLLRVKLIHISDETYAILITMHHIIGDGWSMDILMNELIHFYKCGIQRKTEDLPPLKIQYRDYAEWQHRLLSTDGADADRRYWTNQLGGKLPVLDLPTSDGRPSMQTFNGSNKSFLLGRDLVMGLKRICQTQEATLFMTLLAIVKGLLSHYTGKTDIIIGSPVAGREDAELERQIGLYINTLALRTKFDKTDTFATLLSRVKETTLGAYQHQFYPFDKLVDDLNLVRDLSRSALFNVMVILQNIGINQHSGGKERTPSPYTPSDTPMKRLDVETAVSKFDMTFHFRDMGTGLAINIEYNTDLFNRTFIDQVCRHLEDFVKAVVNDIEQPISEITENKMIVGQDRPELAMFK
jgi:hypothetical protein